MLFPHVLTLLIVSAVIAVVAIPLALGKVPRNPIYGYRTRASMADDETWYEANAHAGRGLLVACLISVAALLALSWLPGMTPELYRKAGIAAVVLPLLGAVLHTALHLRGRPPRGGARRR